MFKWFETRIPMFPTADPLRPSNKLIPFLWSCTQGLRQYILILIVLTALIGVFEAALFAMLGKVVDWLSIFSPAVLWQNKGKELIFMLIIVLASPLLIYLHSCIRFQTLQSVFPMRLRWNFHRLMLSQSLGFYQNEFSGRVSTKVMQTAVSVRDTIMLICDIFVFIVIYFATSLFILGSLGFWLLLPLVLWMICYCGAMLYFIPRLNKYGKIQADARSLMSGRITDAYANIATVKLFSYSDRESNYVKSAMQEFMDSAFKQLRLVSVFNTINHTLSMLLVTSTTGAALLLWQLGYVGVGSVAAACAMSLRLNGMAQWIMWEVGQLFENVGTVQDGVETLSQQQTIIDIPRAPELVLHRGDVDFENVCFRYDKGNTALIDGLSLSINAGEKIGLVGHSGAGKSTIVNLLLRFYDIQSGHILIDGQDIAHVTQDSLRAHVGIVTQDTSLLHRSVRENILYGRPDASEDEMIAAAKQAEAFEFIQTLSDASGRKGFDAHVGERGVKLSGGQRQRIAIARVMLKNAPILLLDEATSALDSEIEAAIQTSLATLMQNKTVIAIAHRLSTIAAMDRLVVMDKGKIVEQGTHAELLAQNGIYTRLWSYQSGGFLGDI